MKKTIAIITSDENDLSSVNFLARDLEESYTRLGPEFIVKVYRFEREGGVSPQCLKDFVDSPPDIVSFIHPVPLRNDSLVVLLRLLKNKGVRFFFHLYGDFLRQSAPMLRIADIIKNEACLFFSPSEAYLKIISQFFNNQNNLAVLPFPLNERQSTSGKTKTDKILNLVYTGRISREKNVNSLAEILDNLKQEGVECHLHLVGAFDDFESSTIGTTSLLGETYYKISPLLKRQNVTYHGFMNADELKKLYVEMNFYISLGLYHDDDFGRAPLEALAAGLPCLLTDWIGYKDIKQNFQERVFLFKTTLEKDAYSISMEGMKDFILSQAKNNKQETAFPEIYSIPELSSKIATFARREILSFSGFTPDFLKLSQKRALFFYQQDGKFSLERYKKIYEVSND